MTNDFANALYYILFSDSRITFSVALFLVLACILVILQNILFALRAIRDTQNEYEKFYDERAYYESEAKSLILPATGITLDDLLSDDGEIPDKYLGGKQ